MAPATRRHMATVTLTVRARQQPGPGVWPNSSQRFRRIIWFWKLLLNISATGARDDVCSRTGVTSSLSGSRASRRLPMARGDPECMWANTPKCSPRFKVPPVLTRLCFPHPPAFFCISRLFRQHLILLVFTLPPSSLVIVSQFHLFEHPATKAAGPSDRAEFDCRAATTSYEHDTTSHRGTRFTDEPHHRL